MPAPDPVIVETPRRETALLLPHLRRILDACLAAMGYQWLPNRPPTYQPLIGDNYISLNVVEPCKFRIVGKWVPNQVPYQMHFRCEELEYNAAGGGPPVAPLGYSSPGPVIDVGEILRVETRTVMEPQIRERVIDLD